MPLRLEIISDQRAYLGERRHKEFGIKGGTIGRSLESDWALEDSSRFLSSRHAAIDFRSGSYYIIDTSTNGVFVNDSETPIGRAKPQRLFHGDRLRLGDYSMLVHLEETDAEKSDLDDSGHIDPVAKAQRAEQAAPSGYTLLSEDELRVLAVEEILADDTATGALKAAAEQAASTLRLVDEKPAAARQPQHGLTEPATNRLPTTRKTAAATPPTAKPNKAPPVPVKAAPKTPPQAVPAKAAARPVTPKPSAPQPKAKIPQTERAKAVPEAPADQAALYAFLRGAGLSPRPLDAKETAVLLHRAGQLVRELTVGLSKTIEQRVEQKNALRLANTTIRPNNNNLLKFSASVDEAIENLFFLQKPEYLPAISAVRESFEEILAHDSALLEAMHAALLDYLERLDPEEIEQKSSVGGMRSTLLGARPEAKYWTRYAEIYAALAQHAPGQFPQLFAEVFANAYEREAASKTATVKTPAIGNTTG